MADGKWVMKDEDAKRVDLSFEGRDRVDMKKLPNFGKQLFIDARSGDANNSVYGSEKCAFCNSEELETGFGGFGEGFGYRSYKCTKCGGTTNFVYKDEIGRYF